MVINDRIRIDIDGAMAQVTLIRPEKHNGMDFPMLKAMIKAQKKIRGMKSIRGVLLQGDGPSFCSGLDFKSVMSKPVSAMAGYSQLWWPFRNDFQTWSMGWRDIPVPVIALIHGNCFGAGMQLALGADIRLCRPDAKLSLMEAKWGLVPDMGGVALMRELIPIDVAKELTLSGRIISGEEAHQVGLVTRVVDDPLVSALLFIEEILTRSPDAVAAGKSLLQQAWREQDDPALRAERIWQRRIMGMKNQRLAVKKQQDDSVAFEDRRI